MSQIYVFKSKASHIVFWGDHAPYFGYSIKTYVTGEKIFMEKRKKPVGEPYAHRGRIKQSSAFIVSNREITLCECTKVIEYTPDMIKLCNCDGVIEIYGGGLTVSTYFGNEIKLSGKIESIRFVGYSCK